MIAHMEIDDETVKHFAAMLNLLVEIAHDKLVLQEFAIRSLGDQWQAAFLKARSDPHFLGPRQMELADIQELRRNGMKMLDQLRKGLPVPPPIVSKNH